MGRRDREDPRDAIEEALGLLLERCRAGRPARGCRREPDVSREVRLGQRIYMVLSVPAEGLLSLSPRQREIARLAGRGCPLKRVARELDLSRSTVEKHLRFVYEKLGIDSRAALGRWSLALEAREGLLEEEEPQRGAEP